MPAYGETQLPDTITITLDGPGLFRTTLSWDGSFVFEDVPEGVFVVTIEAPGRQSASTVVEAEGLGSFSLVSLVLGQPIEDAKTLPPQRGAVVDMETLRVPEKARLAYQKGVKYMSGNEPRRAEKELRRAISEHADFHLAHNALGILYTKSERLKEAQDQFAKAVEIKPSYKPALLNLGLVLLLQREPAKAIGPLLAATRLEQSDARSFDYLGEAYFLTGQLNEAKQNFERCLVLDPTVPGVAFRLGEICARTTDYRQALAYFRQVLEQNPPPDLASAAEANIEKLQSKAE